MTWPVDSAVETDAALVEAARDGDSASYGLLVERYEAIAHRTAFLMGAGDDTADVVQDAFVKAYLALDRFRTTEAFRPWLLTIVANETRNRRRWYARHRTVPLALIGEDLPDVGTLPADAAEARAAGRALRDAVAALSPPHREVVVCRYLLDLSEADTAAILGLRLGTVKSRLSRALRALQAAYGVRP